MMLGNKKMLGKSQTWARMQPIVLQNCLQAEAYLEPCNLSVMETFAKTYVQFTGI